MVVGGGVVVGWGLGGWVVGMCGLWWDYVWGGGCYVVVGEGGLGGVGWWLGGLIVGVVGGVLGEGRNIVVGGKWGGLGGGEVGGGCGVCGCGGLWGCMVV